MTRSLIGVVAAALAASACATTPPPERSPAKEPPSDPVQQSKQTIPIGAPGGPLAPRPLKRPDPLQFVVLSDPNKPVLTFRVVFKAGAADDPKGKEGLTALTARILAEGGTRELSSAELLEALFPMAAELDATADEELTAFIGRVHQDHLARCLDIFGDVLLEPRFDPSEFERLRSDAINVIKNELRGQDDEALGKVALDSLLFEGHPYAHFNGGTVKGLESITLADVKKHWRDVFTQDRVVIAAAGNVTEEVRKALLDRLSGLPSSGAPIAQLPRLTPQTGRAVIFQKPVLSTAISMGYVYPLRRGDPDYFPIALALSYLGEHRQFNGVLFTELREKRGLNYGTYAYAEHFIQHGWGTYALTNVPRSQQEFSIWIRPVESQNAMFATRGAVYFLDRLVREGIPADRFELTRGFLLGYTRLWEQTDVRRTGYAIDELFYGTPDFLDAYRNALQTMTVEEVNAAVKRHLSPDRLNFVFVAPDANELRKLLAEQPPSMIAYPTPKPPDVLEEDKKIAVTPVPVKPDRIEVRDVSAFMEK